jgi:uncharacterized membrane protein YedE/YeeE
MIEALFPNGIFQYAVGGSLIGLGVGIIYLATAITPGASTFLESTLSYFSNIERFQKYTESRNWRLLFTLSIIAGAGIYAAIFQNSIWTTKVSIWRLFFGGILVGVGTRIGKGCTSGHGINGVGSLSKSSLVNVAIFVTVAIATALTVQATGVTP